MNEILIEMLLMTSPVGKQRTSIMAGIASIYSGHTDIPHTDFKKHLAIMLSSIISDRGVGDRADSILIASLCQAYPEMLEEYDDETQKNIKKNMDELFAMRVEAKIQASAEEEEEK